MTGAGGRHKARRASVLSSIRLLSKALLVAFSIKGGGLWAQPPAFVAHLAVCRGSRPIITLLARARARDPEAVAALVRLVEARPLLLRPARPRGGDPRARERAQRNEALRQLAMLVGGADMLSTSCIARAVASRLERYRPAVVEVAPDRVLMREIIASGLPVPGPDRLARILRGVR